MQQPDLTALAQTPDPEVFRQVWARVMPDQALSPIQPDLPASQESDSNDASQLIQTMVPTDSASQLEAWMDWTVSSAMTYQHLPFRTPTMTILARDCRKQFKQLRAVHFLIAAHYYDPKPAVLPSSASTLPLALRERYYAERAQAAVYQQAESRTDDDCLKALVRQLSEHCLHRAKLIQNLLEQM